MARLASLLCLLTLTTQLGVESAHALADLATRESSVGTVAAVDNSGYLPSAGRAEALAFSAKVREHTGQRCRVRVIEHCFAAPESAAYAVHRETHPPRLLLRHRSRSSRDDLPG